MTKKIVTLIFAIFVTASFVYAVDLTIATEVRTGVLWDSAGTPGARMHHNDYGGNEARFRMDMHIAVENLGLRARFEQSQWAEGIGGPQPAQFAWVYAYGNFINDQLRVSAGQLSDSPWRAGGHTFWQGLDHLVGIRTEIMPEAVPGLNFGFTLNTWNLSIYFQEEQTLKNILLETVLGVAYTNRHVHARFGWRLDSDADVYNDHQEGMQMMYRLEPRFLTNLVPHFNAWMTGWWIGIGPSFRGYDEEGNPKPYIIPDRRSYRNWLYLEYSPPGFLAELRIGAAFGGHSSHIATIRPGLFYHVLPFLRVGGHVHYEFGFGDDAPVRGLSQFRILSVEPQLRVSFGPADVTLVYAFHSRHEIGGDRRDGQWVNLRFHVAF